MKRNQMGTEKSLVREVAENNLIVAERVVRNMGLNHDEYYSLAVISLYEFSQRFFQRYTISDLDKFRVKAYRAVKIDIERQVQKDTEYKELEDSITDLSSDDLHYCYKSPDLRYSIEDTVIDKVLLNQLIQSCINTKLEEEVMEFLSRGYGFDEYEAISRFGNGTCRRVFHTVSSKARDKYKIMKLREEYSDIRQVYVIYIDHPLFTEPKPYVVKSYGLEAAMEQCIELAFESTRFYKSGFKVVASRQMVIFPDKERVI